MRPLPESHEVLDRLSVSGGQGLEEGLGEVADVLAKVVPGLVGLSLGLMEHGVTVTYVSSHLDVATLDGVQYLEDGPCVTAARTGEIMEYSGTGPLDEEQWQLFAQASAAAGVMSTLSLPIMDGDRVTAGVNLYGARPDTFDGHREQLALLFGAWAPGAVANADLSFTTRLQAVQAPARLQELEVIDQAVGILMARYRVGGQEARNRLEEAAARAGVDVAVLAHAVLVGDDSA